MKLKRIGITSFTPDDRFEVVAGHIEAGGKFETWRAPIVGFGMKVRALDETEDALGEGEVVPLMLDGEGSVIDVHTWFLDSSGRFEIVRRGEEPGSWLESATRQRHARNKSVASG